MRTVKTRINGHSVTAFRCDTSGKWECEIDAHIPVMEREFEFRSTYVCRDMATAMSAAMSDILGTSVEVNSYSLLWELDANSDDDY